MVVPQSICSYFTRTKAPVNVNIAQARPAGYGADECFEVNSVGLGEYSEFPRWALYTLHRHVRVTRFNSAALSLRRIIIVHSAASRYWHRSINECRLQTLE